MASEAYVALRLPDAPDIQWRYGVQMAAPYWNAAGPRTLRQAFPKALKNSILSLARTPEPRKAFRREAVFFSDTELYLQSHPTFAALKSPALSEYR